MQVFSGRRSEHLQYRRRTEGSRPSQASRRRVVVACAMSLACARGVPKSGTTVLQAILNELLIEASARASQQCVPKHQHVVESGLRYVSIYRHPCDVAVSTFHWKPSGFSDLDEFVMDSAVGLEHIIDVQNRHLEEERRAVGRQPPASVLRVFYESLVADAPATVRVIASYVGLRSLSDAQAQAIATRTSFDAMRSKEANGELKLKQPAIRFGSDSSSRLKNKTAADLDPSRLFGVMTRRGQAGGWRLELNRTVQAYCRAAVRHRSAPPLRWRYADALLAEQSGPRSRVG